MPHETREDILSAFRPVAHPLKKRLSTLGVRQVEAAQYLGIPTASLNASLNGYRPMPRSHEQRLTILCSRLEKASE